MNLDAIEQAYVSTNRRWKEIGDESRPRGAEERSDFEYVVEHAKSNRLSIVATPAGIGKTELLTSLANRLHEDLQIPSENVFYLPLSTPIFRIDADAPLERAVEWHFTNLFQPTLDNFSIDSESKNELYLLVEDIHTLDHWERDVSELLNRFEDLTIVATTPTVERIDHDILDGAGSPYEEDILLIEKFFDQYQRHVAETIPENSKQLCYDLRNALSTYAATGEEEKNELDATLSAIDEVVTDSPRQISRYLHRYMFSGDIVRSRDSNVLQELQLTVHRDIPRFESLESPDDLLRLCALAALNVGETHTLKEWSTTLGVDRRTLDKYVFLLRDFYLLTPSYHHTHDRRRAERLYLRHPKHVVALSGLDTARRMVASVERRRLTVGLLFDHCKRLAFYYHRQNYEVDYWHDGDSVVDFVVPTDRDAVLPITLAIDRDLDRAVDSIEDFIDDERTSTSAGIVLVQRMPGKGRRDDVETPDRVTVVPVWKFLLMV